MPDNDILSCAEHSCFGAHTVYQNKGGVIMTGNREYKSDVFSMLMEEP